MAENFEKIVQAISEEFQGDGEYRRGLNTMARSLLLALHSKDVRVSIQSLCDVTKPHLPSSCDDATVKAVIRVVLSRIQASAVEQLALGNNDPGYMLKFSRDDDYVCWVEDREYLKNLASHAGLIVLSAEDRE